MTARFMSFYKPGVTYTGVHHAFAVAHIHYVNIELEELSKGYLGDYADAELDAFEEETTPFARNLTDKMLENNKDHSILEI